MVQVMALKFLYALFLRPCQKNNMGKEGNRRCRENDLGHYFLEFGALKKNDI